MNIEAEWYCYHDRTQDGPMSEAALARRLGERVVPAYALVWSAASVDVGWQPASTVEVFARAATAAPLPMPAAVPVYIAPPESPGKTQRITAQIASPAFAAPPLPRTRPQLGFQRPMPHAAVTQPMPPPMAIRPLTSSTQHLQQNLTKPTHTTYVKRWLLLLSIVIAGIWYLCTGVVGPLAPPVSLTYRDSYVGHGIVIAVQNEGKETLYNIAIEFDGQPKKIIVGQLAPTKSIKAGWMELDKTPQRGTTYKVYADGYSTPYFDTAR